MAGSPARESCRRGPFPILDRPGPRAGSPLIRLGSLSCRSTARRRTPPAAFYVRGRSRRRCSAVVLEQRYRLRADLIVERPRGVVLADLREPSRDDADGVNFRCHEVQRRSVLPVVVVPRVHDRVTEHVTPSTGGVPPGEN